MDNRRARTKTRFAPPVHVAVVAVLLVLASACGSHVPRGEIIAANAAADVSNGHAGAQAGSLTNGVASGGEPSGAGGIGTEVAPSAIGAGADTAAPGGSAASGADAQAAGPACEGECAPLIIGSVGTYSGIVGQNVVSGVKALQAWVEAINAKGGMAGHPVQLHVGDDGGDPGRHRALVQEFVEERKVVAFVYNSAPLSGQASVQYVTEKRIPVIGSDSAEAWFNASPMFFAQTTVGLKSLQSSAAAAALGLKADGITDVGIIACSDGVQICEDAFRYLPEYARNYGLNMVYEGKGSLAQPDFTSNCLAAQQAGAEFIFIVMDGNSLQRIARSCTQANYRPKYSVGQQIQLDLVARDPNLQGSIGTTATAPPFAAGNDGVEEFKATMAEYSPGTSVNGATILGWTSAKLLEAAATSLSERPTSNDLLNGLWSLNGNDLGGLTLPLRFAKDQNNDHPPCVWLMVIKDEQFTSPDGGERHCIDV